MSRGLVNVALRLPSICCRVAHRLLRAAIARYACDPRCRRCSHSLLSDSATSRIRAAARNDRTLAVRVRRRATVAGLRELRARRPPLRRAARFRVARALARGSARARRRARAAAFAAARSSSRPARPPRSSTRAACAPRCARSPSADRSSERVRAEGARRDQSRARPQRRHAPRRAPRRRHVHPLVRPRRRRVRRPRHPRRRDRGRRAHPRRAHARAPLRRSALPARVLRQHEERTPPLVRHGDVRQSREGRAPPGEAAKSH